MTKLVPNYGALVCFICWIYLFNFILTPFEEILSFVYLPPERCRLFLYSYHPSGKYRNAYTVIMTVRSLAFCQIYCLLKEKQTGPVAPDV